MSAAATAGFLSLPPEILLQIIDTLRQGDVQQLILSHKLFSEIAADEQYRRPQFSSTYRLAQFFQTVAEMHNHAVRVRNLNLSVFPSLKLKIYSVVSIILVLYER